MSAPVKPDPLGVGCKMCGARPGAVCRVWPWKRASKPHAARVRAAREREEGEK